MKYIIDLEDMGNGLYKAKGANTLVFDKKGIKNILTPYEEPKQEIEQWPQKGDEYCSLNFDGMIITNNIWTGTSLDKKILAIGNCFLTKEEAEFEAERLKVLHKMKRFAEPEDREWNREIKHFAIVFDFYRHEVDIYNVYLSKTNEIYFESKEKAQECIDAVGADRIKKYYCRVKE